MICRGTDVADTIATPVCAAIPRRTASSFSFGPGRISTTLKAIIGANVAMFVLTAFVPSIVMLLGLVPVSVVREFRVWQLGTYMFLHGGFFPHRFQHAGVVDVRGPARATVGDAVLF